MAWGVGNLGGGVSLSKAYSFVYVEYLEGATLNCVNSNGVSVSSKYIDVSPTIRIFKIDDGVTECTITSTLDQSTRYRYASRIVSNITNGSSHYVKLNYYDYLSLANNQCSGLSGGWSTVGMAYSSTWGNSRAQAPTVDWSNSDGPIVKMTTSKKNGIMRTINTFNVTGYEALRGEIKVNSVDGNNRIIFGACTTSQSYFEVESALSARRVSDTSTTSVIVYLSKFTNSNVYFYVGLATDSSSIPSVTIKRLWLEKLPE